MALVFFKVLVIVSVENRHSSGLRAHRGSGAIYTRRPRRAWYKMERSDFSRGAFRSGILARRCAKARQT